MANRDSVLGDRLLDGGAGLRDACPGGMAPLAVPLSRHVARALAYMHSLNPPFVHRDVKTGKPLRYAGPAHLLTIAPARTGKGVGTIIPNLLEYPFAVVCIDPKGENARIAARQRGKFGAVHVLDPFGVTGLASAAFNPLDRIDPNGLDLADDCMTLADALVYDAPGEAVNG